MNSTAGSACPEPKVFFPMGCPTQVTFARTALAGKDSCEIGLLLRVQINMALYRKEQVAFQRAWFSHSHIPESYELVELLSNHSYS